MCMCVATSGTGSHPQGAQGSGPHHAGYEGGAVP